MTSVLDRPVPLSGGDRTGGQRPVLAVLWGRPGVAAAVVAAVGGLTGAVSGYVMLRGPSSASGGLSVMLTGLLLGAVAGLVLGRRRAIVIAVVSHVAALELVRWPIDGPTVDGTISAAPTASSPSSPGAAFTPRCSSRRPSSECCTAPGSPAASWGGPHTTPAGHSSYGGAPPHCASSPCSAWPSWSGDRRRRPRSWGPTSSSPNASPR